MVVIINNKENRLMKPIDLPEGYHPSVPLPAKEYLNRKYMEQLRRAHNIELGVMMAMCLVVIGLVVVL
jgi:hypothetical protein